MQPGILITNNADRHPPEKYAEITAQMICQLIQVPETPTTEAGIAAKRAKATLPIDIGLALESHYDDIQTHEQDQLADVGDERLNHELKEPADKHAAAIAAVMAVFDQPEYAVLKDGMAGAEQQRVIRDQIAKALRGQMHIERLYHAKQNPDTPEAAAFRNLHGLEHPRGHGKGPKK